MAGGIAQWDTLLAGTPEQVAEEVRDGIAQTGGLGYIVAAGCVTPIPVSETNIRAAIAVAQAGH